MRGFEIGTVPIHLRSEEQMEAHLDEYRALDDPDLLLEATRDVMRMRYDIAEMKSSNYFSLTEGEQHFLNGYNNSAKSRRSQEQVTKQDNQSKAVPVEIPKECVSFSISLPLTGSYKITICN